MNHAVADADADLQHGTVRFTAAVFAVAVAFSTFQVITAAFSPISSTVVRAIHVGFLLLMTFLLMPPFKQRWLGWFVGGVAFVASFYHWIFEADLIQRAGELTTPDMVIGILTIVLVFEAARRVMGIALPLICAAFLLYGLFGQYLPAPLQSSRLRIRPGDRTARIRHRGHLRYADVRVLLVYLPVHPFRFLPGAGRDDQAL